MQMTYFCSTKVSKHMLISRVFKNTENRRFTPTLSKRAPSGRKDQQSRLHFSSNTHRIQKVSVEYCSEAWPSASFSRLHTRSLKLNLPARLSYTRARPQVAQFGREASSRKSPGFFQAKELWMPLRSWEPLMQQKWFLSPSPDLCLSKSRPINRVQRQSERKTSQSRSRETGCTWDKLRVSQERLWILASMWYFLFLFFKSDHKSAYFLQVCASAVLNRRRIY